MTKEEAYFMNPAILAYLGDAVYELFVRQRMVDSGQVHVDRMSQEAVRYVRAEGQALAIKRMMEGLTEEEQQLVKRARNKKVTSKPRNVDIHIYKWATAFEALMGYLYLTGRVLRAKELFLAAFDTKSGMNGYSDDETDNHTKEA